MLIGLGGGLHHHFGEAYYGRVLGEVGLCVGFSVGKPFCQTPVIASAFFNELLTTK